LFPRRAKLSASTGNCSNTQEQRRPNRNRAQWIQELNLTPEQTQQIQAIEISIKTRFPNAGKQRQAKQELLELMAGKMRAKFEKNIAKLKR